MSVFKRAEWHSGLTYTRVCDQCKTTFNYTDRRLDFRPWFPDGFVYCPNCNKPLRHSENYAIIGEKTGTPLPLFCSQCGKEYGGSDRFCTQCGNKR